MFVLLAVVHTWPLASNPAHLSRNDNSDTILNEWTLAWVAHQLPRHPLHLFDANIFYPERRTFGYSEAMIVQGVMAMPIFMAGGSPVLAFNLLLLAGMALTGWAYCLLMHRWTGSWGAGYVGGSLAAFNSHVLVRLPHLQIQHVEFTALILFALDRLLALRRLRDALLLGAGFALQGLTSVYLLVFSTWMLIFAALARAREWLRRDPVRMVKLFAAAGITATLVLAPYLLAYYHVHRDTGFSRTVGDASRGAGSWLNYVRTGSRLHYALWAGKFFDKSESSTFPGIVTLFLVAAAIAQRETRRDARVRMCLAAAIGCAAVSVLPRMPIYPTLHRVIPLFSPIRTPAHIGQIVLLMLAVVAGFGVAGLGRRWPNARAWPAVVAGLFLLVNLEALRAPIGYTPFSEISPAYDVLAERPEAVVVELPFWPPHQSFASAAYMLNSTRHWRPMLNGYSGFRPSSYNETYDAIHRFPDTAALAALHHRGVTHVVVHAEWFMPADLETIARTASLQPVATAGDVRIYRLR